MNSFWIPKKQPLYAPMLGTFGGGSARGFNPGGGGGSGYIDATFSQKGNGANTSLPNGVIADDWQSFNFGASDTGHYSQSDFNYSSSSSILTFNIPAGSYDYQIRGGRGSGGPEPHTYTGNITFSSDTDVLFLGGLNGTGSYGSGGGTFLVLGSIHSNIQESDALLVAGGTAAQYGGYISSQQTDPNMNSSLTSAKVRILPTKGNQQNYDSGASLMNYYNVTAYAGGGAQNFNSGGQGKGPHSCGGNVSGGFGGGAGGCPGGAGGLVGGYAGGDGTTTSGTAGTSYYNTSYATNNTTVSSGVHTSDQGSIGGYNQADSGFLRLTGAIA